MHGATYGLLPPALMGMGTGRNLVAGGVLRGGGGGGGTPTSVRCCTSTPWPASSSSTSSAPSATRLWRHVGVLPPPLPAGECDDQRLPPADVNDAAGENREEDIDPRPLAEPTAPIVDGRRRLPSARTAAMGAGIAFLNASMSFVMRTPSSVASSRPGGAPTMLCSGPVATTGVAASLGASLPPSLPPPFAVSVGGVEAGAGSIGVGGAAYSGCRVCTDIAASTSGGTMPSCTSCALDAMEVHMLASTRSAVVCCSATEPWQNHDVQRQVKTCGEQPQACTHHHRTPHSTPTTYAQQAVTRMATFSSGHGHHEGDQSLRYDTPSALLIAGQEQQYVPAHRAARVAHREVRAALASNTAAAATVTHKA